VTIVKTAGKQSCNGCVTAVQGEDIYGRPLDTSSNTFLHFPDAPPSPWPPIRDAATKPTKPPTICARLLRSGGIKQKGWCESAV
jgi:hypothetical protein